MFLKIKVCGNNADFASYIFAKNPNRYYISNEKVLLNDINIKDGEIDFSELDLKLLSEENIKLLIKDKVLDKELNILNQNENSRYFVRNNELIRKKLTGDLENHFVYKKYKPNEVEVCLFSMVDSLNFSKEFAGYVNEKEYLVTSVFQSVMNDVLRTALTKEGEGFDNQYDLTYEIGPFKPKISEDNLKLLFTSLGYEVDVINVNEPISFNAKRQDIVFLNLRKTSTIRESLRQIFVLISAIDNFKHFKPKENDMQKLKKYTDSWIEDHPLNKMIVDRYLSYSSYSKELINEIKEKKKNDATEVISEAQLEAKGYGENGLSLNILRLQKMKEAIIKCNPNKVLDFGCGEGNLLETLSEEQFDIIGVDSSEKAINRAYVKMKKNNQLHSKCGNTTLLQSSLYYKDSRLKNVDTVVLCEVIEHIELERVPQIIDNIMFLQPKNLIISTPNKDFNKFFTELKGELRYYDHRFEFTYKEFEEFCHWIKATYGYSFVIDSFGKEIEGVKPTVMATFIKEDK